MAGLRFNVTKTVKLDASSGGGTVFYDCGGYDVVIDSVVVSTLTNAKEPQAKLFIDTTNPAGFIGGTNVGSYDTSSTQVGLSAGSTLSCVWSGGDANTVATLQISGTQYAPGQGPKVTRGTVIFQRTIAGAAQFGEKIALADVLASTALAAAGVLTGPVVDMRQWASHYLTVDATRTAAATDYNPIAIRLLWYDDPLGANLIFADAYEILAFRSAAPFETLGGRLLGQDALHGPFMRIMISNLGPDQCNASYRLSGTTRGLPGPYYKEVAQTTPPDEYNPDNFVITPEAGRVVGLPAGTTVTYPALMRYGRARWRISTSQAFVCVFNAGSAGPIDSTDSGVPTIQSGEFILPKRPLLVEVTNNAGVAMDILFNVITLSDKF